jgi:phosphoglycolate phosphatase
VKKRVSLLVCDLDNTLYDWVSYFVPSFYAMVDQIVEIVGCDREQLLDDFRAVHVRNHDSEHGFAALETETVKRHFPGLSAADIARQIDPALYAFNRMRKATLHTYAGVESTLAQLREADVVLVAHSEAKFHSVVDRLSRLRLWSYFDAVYCRERSSSSHPFPERAERVASDLELAKVRELSHHQRKPSREVLTEICDREGAVPAQSGYVGDSLAKDMAMAKEAGLFAIWARYGTIVSPTSYERLVRVSHWTPDEVAFEAELRQRAKAIVPDAVLTDGFFDLLSVIEV